MFRSILLFSFCLHLGLLSCGRFEHGDIFCTSHEDCPQDQLCREGFCVSKDVPRLCADASQQLCGEACVDLQTNTSHCGVCNHVCPPEAHCRNGSCETCPSSQRFCGEACVDLQTNTSHCGVCNHVCSQGAPCWGGACIFPRTECTEPRKLCGEDCVDLQTNTSHCGECDRSCPPEAYCWRGQCVCSAVEKVLCQNQCVSILSYLRDKNNCGACGNTCAPGFVCRLGFCRR
jgi:hypothetical protein